MYHRAAIDNPTMLDSAIRGEGAMAEQRAKAIDERFDEVTQAFLDQRDFTLFCSDKLRAEIRDVEGRLTGRLDGLELRFDGLEGKVDGLDRRVGGLEVKVEGLDRRVGGLEGKVDGMAQAMDRRFTRNELLLTEILNEVKKR